MFYFEVLLSSFLALVSIGSKCLISNPSPPRNCCQMQVKREQAQSLKQELEEGLERWRQQVGTIISVTLYC